jgi:ABC-2 type transport system ATP-binding protein
MEHRLTEAELSRAGIAAARQVRDPILVLQGVSKRYGHTVAVQELSLTLYGGEVFAFLGPNGAGKTTTMKMSTGLLRSDTGHIWACGFAMDAEGRAAKRGIAYVPDQPFLYDKLTGREFIHFARDMYGVPRAVAAERLAALTARLDMGGFLDQLTEAYSHGMKQKVALAAALIHEPRLLVVDEPIVGLDPRTIRVIKDIFREIAERGATVFMSTHTLDIAEAVADRIGILNDGRMVALGTLQELRAQASPGSRLEDIFLAITNARPGRDRLDGQSGNGQGEAR